MWRGEIIIFLHLQELILKYTDCSYFTKVNSCACGLGEYEVCYLVFVKMFYVISSLKKKYFKKFTRGFI